MSGGVVSLTPRIAYAQAPTVSSIIVQGNQRVESDTIRSYFRPGPNGQLDAFQIDEGVKALISTGLFQEVRPTIQGGRFREGDAGRGRGLLGEQGLRFAEPGLGGIPQVLGVLRRGNRLSLILALLRRVPRVLKGLIKLGWAIRIRHR